MRRIGIIGLGTVFSHHLQVLERVKNLFTLIAVYDKDPSRTADALKMCEELPGMNEVCGAGSLDEFLKMEMDTVLIATPPTTHYRIAKCCILAGRNVLLEKPADLNVMRLRRLYMLADKHHCLIHVAFHSAYAADLLWFLKHRADIEQKYGLCSLRNIECRFEDPYVINGVLLPGRETLCGSYLDSTVNEISVCCKLVSLSDFYADEFETRSLPGMSGSTVVSSCLHLVKEDQSIFILCYTDWTSGRNSKTTRLQYDNGFILLDHSRQSVLLGETDILFENSLQPRLVTQYVNLFTDYASYLERGISNCEESLSIHCCLLGVLGDGG